MEQFVYKNQKKLRCGITTGSCAAAAAMAAARKLLLDESSDQVELITPKQVKLLVPVLFAEEDTTFCTYKVIKDSGDDPDVTNACEIFVRVEYFEQTEQEVENKPFLFSDSRYAGIYLDGGIGIGRVTREGLEQSIGQAAINRVPRNMIFQAVYAVKEQAAYEGDLLATVSIPEGVTIAKKTFNGRLGIEGGLSVLGTSGILEPMSEKAIVDTIETEIKQRRALGADTLLVAPGNYGQAYIKEYLGLDLEQSVKCSNYLGETFDLAVSYGFSKLLLVGNIGKLIKLAAGIMNTHSKQADGRMEILAVHTVLCGGTKEMAETIMNCINTEDVLSYLKEWQLFDAVLASVMKKIEQYVSYRVGEELVAGVMMFSERYGFLGETTYAREIANSLMNG